MSTSNEIAHVVCLSCYVEAETEKVMKLQQRKQLVTPTIMMAGFLLLSSLNQLEPSTCTIANTIIINHVLFAGCLQAATLLLVLQSFEIQWRIQGRVQKNPLLKYLFNISSLTDINALACFHY